MFLVDWAVKMRIRPPEFETSICDAKYNVSLNRNEKGIEIPAEIAAAHGGAPTPPPRALRLRACRARRPTVGCCPAHGCAMYGREANGRGLLDAQHHRATLSAAPCEGRARRLAALRDGRWASLLVARDTAYWSPMVALLRCARWRWTRDGCARIVAPPCEISRWRRPPAGRRSVNAPASFRRCHDGWSEFF
ncbi:hypothetical protein F511_44992 [Dorcoceras hygrometricum]|uniref:Uncharacterized protein n=1 Tax=Dorcoceras hygrometricum TaxID=472368 RepID=A0A2Z7CSF7_9LAMI|nr:hypothetical protein F511_44992 [Dorcoceras hygrometricum]